MEIARSLCVHLRWLHCFDAGLANESIDVPQPPKQKPGLGFPLARIGALLSLATGACHNLATASYSGKRTGETSLFRRMYDTLKAGDVVVADALFDNYFIACELRQRGIDIVTRVQHERVESWTKEIRPDGDILSWQRPQKPRGMTRERYPAQRLMATESEELLN